MIQKQTIVCVVFSSCAMMGIAQGDQAELRKGLTSYPQFPSEAFLAGVRQRVHIAGTGVVDGVRRASGTSTFVVDSVGDTGDSDPSDPACDDGTGNCTLRAAIEQANATAGANTIHFAIGSGQQVIEPLTGLPVITGPLTIDGRTQSGFSSDPLIVLNGTNAPAGTNGLIFEAPGCELYALAIFGFRQDVNSNDGFGVVLGFSGANATLEGNWIGVDPDLDELSSGNTTGIGVFSSGSRIGGAAIGQRNTLSGNELRGVFIAGGMAFAVEVQGNYIGVLPDGSGCLPNDLNGVEVVAAANNVIGGSNSGEGNVVSCNGLVGVILGNQSTGNIIAGNRIGTDPAGMETDPDGIPNSGDEWGNKSDGVELQSPGNTVGGTVGVTPGGPCSGACNIISGNEDHGIQIVLAEASGNIVTGNYIGTTKDGGASLGNRLNGIWIADAAQTIIGGSVGNVISGNGSDGIALLRAQGTVIKGNIIGMDPDGGRAVPNEMSGISVVDSAMVEVGGSAGLTFGACTGDCNHISGNDADGIFIDGPTSQDNTVAGNLIGGTADGAMEIANDGHGVHILEASSNTIGVTGTAAADEANRIIGNGGDGVRIEGNTAASNSIRKNSIHANLGLSINLVSGPGELSNGVTPNDSFTDMDSGANSLINFPAMVAYITVDGTSYITGVNRTNQEITVDLYASESRGDSGHGEAEEFLIDIPEVPPNANFKFALPGSLPHPLLSATATNAAGSTSEFSYVCEAFNGSIDGDADGLCDDWEINGIDFNGNGIVDVPLHMSPYDADTSKKDIYVEVDEMGLVNDGGVLKYFGAPFAALPTIHQAFRGAPGNLALHFLVDSSSVGNSPYKDGALPHMPQIRVIGTKPGNDNDAVDFKYGSASNPCDGYFGTDADRGASNCEEIIGAKQQFVRYVLFVDRVDENRTGVSNGTDLVVVAMGHMDAKDKKKIGGAEAYAAGTMMHELGHTLGLCHGGPAAHFEDACSGPCLGDVCQYGPLTAESCSEDTDCDPFFDGNYVISYKPNYLSVMNYLYQLPSVVKDRPLDYSRWVLPDDPLGDGFLDETVLDEQAGIGPLPFLFSGWAHSGFYADQSGTCKGMGKLKVGDPIDWDLDGFSGGVAQASINDNDTCLPGSLEILHGAEDWTHVRVPNRHLPSFGLFGVNDNVDVDELNAERIIGMASATDFDEDGINNFDDNCPEAYNPFQEDVDEDLIGDACDLINFVVDPLAVVGGSSVQGVVTMRVPADVEGLKLDGVISDALDHIIMPGEVIIPGGETQVTFDIMTMPVAAMMPTTLYVREGPDTLEAPLLLLTGSEAVPEILAATPADGFIDPLDPTDGIRHISVEFNGTMTNLDGSPLSAEAFSLFALGDSATPIVASVDTSASPTVAVEFDGPLQPGERYRLEARVASGDGVPAALTLHYGALPCDVDHSGVVDALDPEAFVAEFSGTRALNLVDTNRSGNVNITDATAFVLLFLNDWDGASLPRR